MTTYFIRHQKPWLVAQRLFDERRIAIFFDEAPWEDVFDQDAGLPNPRYFTDEYLLGTTRGQVQTYKSALRYINTIRTEGGYIFAEYGGGFIGAANGLGCVLGTIAPGATVENVDGISPVTLQMHPDTTRVISYADFPVLLAIRPQRGTLCVPSRTYGPIARHFLENFPVTPSPDLMHPRMVEQMCVEYLRKIGLRNGEDEWKLDYESIRPGRTMCTIDIAGRLINGTSLFAQVKNAPLEVEVAEQFTNFVPQDAKGVLFSRFDGDIAERTENIMDVSVDHVFECFLGLRRTMIADLIGAPNLL